MAATRARDYLTIPLLAGDKKKRFLGPLWEGLGIGEDIPWGREIHPDSGRGVIVVDSRTLDAEKRELRPFRVGLDFKKTKSGSGKTDPSRVRYHSWERRRKEIREKGKQGGKILAATSVAKPKDEEILSSGAGTIFGRFVHDIFRTIDLHHPKEVKTIARALGAEAGLDEAAVERGVVLVEWGLSSSVLGRAARSPRLWKELPFVYRHRDDLVEGFIDLAFEEDGNIVLVDFKTDMVKSEKELEEKVRLYAPQGMIYATALEKITRKKVKEVIFLFLSAKAERPIPLGKRALHRVERLLKEAASAAD